MSMIPDARPPRPGAPVPGIPQVPTAAQAQAVAPPQPEYPQQVPAQPQYPAPPQAPLPQAPTPYPAQPQHAFDQAMDPYGQQPIQQPAPAQYNPPEAHQYMEQPQMAPQQPYYPEVPQPQYAPQQPAYEQPGPVLAPPVQPVQTPYQQPMQPDPYAQPAAPAGYPQQAPQGYPQQPAPAPAQQLPARPAMRAGWDAAQQVMDASSSFANSFKPGPNISIVKFLQDFPYANYNRHWIARIVNGQPSRRPYNCLGSIGQHCPLCAVGDQPNAVSAFNIAVIANDGTAQLMTYDTGPAMCNTIQGWNKDPRVGPITRDFFAVSKPDGKGTRQGGYPVPAQLLPQQFGINPPDPNYLASLGLYAMEQVDFPSAADLQEVAASLQHENG